LSNHTLLLLASLALTSASAHAQESLRIEVSDDGLASVSASGVPLEDVLRAVAREYGLSVRSSEALDERVTVMFESQSLPHAVSRILNGRRFALLYVGSWDGPPEDSPNRLSIFAGRSSEVADDPKEGGGHGGAPLDMQPYWSASPLVRIDALIERAGEDARQAVPDLALIALTDPNAEMREEAVHALGDFNDSSIRFVLEQARWDSAPQVREAAEVALADFRAQTP
jgi:hypothetical protein